MPAAETIGLLVRHLPVDPDLEVRTGRPLGARRTLALVAAGGTVGTLARAGVASALSETSGRWPWATLSVNVVGSLLLGVLLTTLHERFPHVRVARPLLGAGFCGGFTTFSTFAVDAVALSDRGRDGLAVLYVATSLAGSLLAAFAGLAVARVVLRLSDRHAWLRRAHAAGVVVRGHPRR